jgi:hypothetical protein
LTIGVGVVKGTVTKGGRNGGIGITNSGLLAKKLRYVAWICFSKAVATSADVGVDAAPTIVSV